MSETVGVKLTGSAKVNGQYHKPGDIVFVTDKVLGQLLAENLLPQDMAAEAAERLGKPFSVEVLTSVDFDQTLTVAVAAAVAEREALWSTAFDHFETMADDRYQAAIDMLKAEHATEIDHDQGVAMEKEVAAARELTEARERIATLETELAAAKAALNARPAGDGTGGKTTKKA